MIPAIGLMISVYIVFRVLEVLIRLGATGPYATQGLTGGRRAALATIAIVTGAIALFLGVSIVWESVETTKSLADIWK